MRTSCLVCHITQIAYLPPKVDLHFQFFGNDCIHQLFHIITCMKYEHNHYCAIKGNNCKSNSEKLRFSPRTCRITQNICKIRNHVRISHPPHDGTGKSVSVYLQINFVPVNYFKI